jgi:hypothetical protein
MRKIMIIDEFNIFLNFLLVVSITLNVIILIENKFNINKILKFPWGIDFDIFVSSCVISFVVIFIKRC